MKIKRLHMAVMSLLLPVSVFSLGMGDMKVDSLLNQPFHAEIPLIDVGGVPLTNIKVNIASIENFERVGLQRTEVLDLLRLQIKANPHGQPVIDISSTERIDDPCIQMVIDMAWARGQLYRAYTVLLDPPDYTLLRSIKHNAPRVIDQQTGAIDKPVATSTVEQVSTSKLSRRQTTYGPTMANEGIWQIAQRYSTPDTTLPQIILAIVGTNSDAFTQGNLNGLKTGARLKIPSTSEVLKVPEDLARQEVQAQDAAWKAKTEIRHVLLPPYIDGVPGVSQFTTASPVADKPILPTVVEALAPPVQTPAAQEVMPASGGEAAPVVNVPAPGVPIPASPEMLNSIETLKAQLKNSSEVIDSMRRENTTVKAQLQELQNKTAPLEKTLSEQNKAIAQLNQQLLALTNGIKTTTKTSPIDQKTPESEEPMSVWLYLLPLIAVVGGCGLGYWARMRVRERGETEHIGIDDVATDEEVKPDNAEPIEKAGAPVAEEQAVDDTQHQLSFVPGDVENVSTESVLPPVVQSAEDIEPVLENVQEESVVEETEEKPEDYILDFEPGLDKVVSCKKDVAIKNDAYQDDAGIDYFIEPSPQAKVEQLSDEHVLFDSILSAEQEKTGESDTTVEENHAPVSAGNAPEDIPEQQQPENKLVKSTLALDTLMDLAKTYVSMDDIEAARLSLEEVIQFGSDEQKAEAIKLLDEIKGR